MERNCAGCVQVGAAVPPVPGDGGEGLEGAGRGLKRGIFALSFQDFVVVKRTVSRNKSGLQVICMDRHKLVNPYMALILMGS